MSIYPEDFYSETPPARIIGTECEYNLQMTGMQPESTASRYPNLNAGFEKLLAHRVIRGAGIAVSKSFLGTGGRAGKIYADVGHLEYASPESFGPASAVVEDLAGMDIVRRIVTASEVEHAGLYRQSGTYIPAGLRAQAHLQARNETAGYHENYSIPRDMTSDESLWKLAPTILATRLYAMNGMVDDRGYSLSQKVNGIGGAPVEDKKIRPTQKGNKPMMMLLGPHSDSDVIEDTARWARLEVRFAEPGLSPLARFAGIGAVALALRLVEHQWILDPKEIQGLTLKDPVKAAHMASHDMSISTALETLSGKTITALEIQEELGNLTYKLSEKVRLPDDELFAMDVIADMVAVLRQPRRADGRFSADALRQIDFAARHAFLRNALEDDDDITASNAAVLHRSLVWDRVDPEGGGTLYWNKVAQRDERVRHMEGLAAESGISPRAKRRQAIIDEGKYEIAGWGQYRDRSQAYSLGDPYND